MGRYDTSRYRGAPLSTSLGADGRLGEGFPPGMTVDELRWYSRRRPNDSQKRDNLSLEAGSLKDISSEYRISFQAPQFVARSLGDLANQADNEKENLNIRRCSSHSEDLVGKSVIKSRFRPKEYLRPEGDMIFQTENADKFIEYILSKRPDLLRRNTELKLEGELETLTENKDKFITFDSYCTRPPLAKRDTNLHLEGDFLHFPEYKEVFVDFPRHRPISIKPNPWLHVNNEEKMDTFSETHDQFIQYSLAGLKPELLKRPTYLKCENDLEFIPEYKDSFKEFPIEKRCSIKQNSCLRLDGELYTTPEYKDKYVPLPLMRNESSKHPDSLMLDETFIPSVQNNDIAYVPSNTKSQNVLTKSEDNLPVSTDNRETSPKATYPRKTEPSNIPNENSKQNPEDHKKRLTDISHKAIPLASYENTVTARPPKGRRSRTSSINSTSSLRRQEIGPNEKILRERRNSGENKLVDQHNIPYQPRKLKSPEMNPGDNRFECQPEYRKAYVDYLIRERLPRSRSPDKVLEKPPLNLKWLKRGDSSNPSFDIVRQNKNYAGGKNVTYDSPAYKPSSRRGSVASITGSPRRSESPTYKLQVTNVDEPKRGFGSRSYKKGLSEYTMQNRSNSPARQMKINEPIQSNVVLREKSRRQWQRNTNLDYDEPRNNSFVVLDQSRQPQRVSKWDSPWYKYPDD